MKRVLWVVLIVIAVVSAARGVSNALWDSGDFHWDVARLLVERYNPYVMFLANQPAYTDAIVDDLYQPNQLPSSLVWLFPYALLSWNAAIIAWFVTNIVATGVILWVFARWHPELLATHTARWAVVLLFLAGTPWRHSFGKGQHSLVALAVFMVAVYLLDRRKPLWSGIALALSFLKYSITFPLLPYFLYKRDVRPPLLAFGIHTVVHLLIARWIQASPLELLIDPLKIAATVTLGRGYLDVFTIARLYEWNTGVAWGGAVVLALLAIGLAMFRPSRTPSERDVWVLAFLMLISNIVIYHSWYDFITLLPLVVLYCSPIPMRPAIRWTLGIAVALFWYFNRLLVEVIPLLPATVFWSKGFYTVSVLWYGVTLVVVGIVSTSTTFPYTPIANHEAVDRFPS